MIGTVYIEAVKGHLLVRLITMIEISRNFRAENVNGLIP
jgi:hypothetical protein